MRGLGPLVKAEWYQYFRNPLVLWMAGSMPVSMAGLLYGLNWHFSDGEIAAIDNAAMATEAFLLSAMVFVVYYPVLSTFTSRRDANILRRMRTGEVSDAAIVSSLILPPALFAVVSAAVFIPLLWWLSGVRPESPLAFVTALLFAAASGALLALATSGFTSSVETAQLTSTPVMTLAVLSQEQMRVMMPPVARGLVEKSPFGIVSELGNLGWFGGEVKLSTFLLMAGWIALLVLVCVKIVRWTSYRA